jgi:sulfide dehydrogenase cytochrome subunit
MKTKILKASVLFASALVTVSLFSCKKELMTMENKTNTALSTESSSVVKAVPVDLPGRALAANCFQCHGTNGYAGELKIAGESKSGILSEINEMKSKNPRSNIMNVHAQAYTAQEMDLIADFISKQ